MSRNRDDRAQSYLQAAVEEERQKFEEYYLWIQKHMPARFFEEIDKKTLLLIIHDLMRFDSQDFFSHIHSKSSAIVLSLNTPDADLRILKLYRMHGIKYYTTFVSDSPPPFHQVQSPLKIALILFTECEKTPSPLPTKNSEEEQIVLQLIEKAKTEDTCQYHVGEMSQSKEKSHVFQLFCAWRIVPKYNLLYRIVELLSRHQLGLEQFNAVYLQPYSQENIFVCRLHLHRRGIPSNQIDLSDFLKEFVTFKYFTELEDIETTFVQSKLVCGNSGHFLKALVYFVHQVLVHADANLYSLPNVEEGICRHPELAELLVDAFSAKFEPGKVDLDKYQKKKENFLTLVAHLDTGQEINDTRRKNILKQALNFIDYTLKTNFYEINKTALSFRLDPFYLNYAPYDRQEKFPELPYAIFFIKGMDFIGFHIRFKDLSRGGLRTVIPKKMEQALVERNNVFLECYGLAYTQHKKNKDIPEGGAKAVIFLEPSQQFPMEMHIYQEEMRHAGLESAEIEKRLSIFEQEHQLSHLYQAQRAYIENFLTLINCKNDGTLKAQHTLDYWKKPEYIYLGPDENMHTQMIVWISNYSVKHDYKPGSSFISSKPGAGINHKEYGVTSLGVNVCMEEVLKFLEIDPYVDTFTIKISGGPDGDVAGNQILNLQRHYPKTAKLLSLIDISGTIYDPIGLDLNEMARLFHEGKSLRFYPPEKLSEGGFLLDLQTKREQTAYAQQTLCWRMQKGRLVEEWFSGHDMNHLLRYTIMRTKTDVFIPGGGRPRTLNDINYKDFLDEAGKPTARAIVEGANLYLTPFARRALEKLGVIIIKDSSANKGGVICSSFEVLCGLVLSEKEFVANKPQLMHEILEIIRTRAKDEAQLLLHTHIEKSAFLTDISEWISERINTYMYQLLDYLQTVTLPDDVQHPLIKCLLNYCPPFLRHHYAEHILKKIPDIHKKAIIACYIASRLVYKRGLGWSPSIVDILPLIAHDSRIIDDD